MGKSKCAPLPFRSDYTKTFVKAWERYNKAGRRDMHDTAAIMSLVLSGNPIPAEYSDHALTGDMQGFRELHIGGIIFSFIASMIKSIWWCLPTWGHMRSCLSSHLPGGAALAGATCSVGL